MNEARDIYLRAHTVVLDERKPKSRGTTRAPQASPRRARYALVFGCQSRPDIAQELTIGFYRVLKLQCDTYTLEEEGAFFDDALCTDERRILEKYFQTNVAATTSFPPRFPLRSRSEFVKDVFYWYARKGALIVGFDLCDALTRLARRWPRGNEHEWSLVLSEYPDGNENLNHPRVLIKPLDSKKAFIRFRFEWIPKDKKGRSLARSTDIDKACFLDLRTLLSGLFNKSITLRNACDLGTFKKYELPQIGDYVPTGTVTIAEIEHARHTVRCMAALFSAAKQEFDLHPIQRSADRVFSPASMVKAYLDEMGIRRPAEKFAVPDEILGIAMESFTAGRSETKLRHVEVPVVPLDFLSEYATVSALLGIMEVLRAEELTFEDVTDDVRELVRTVTLDKCFIRKMWPRFRFFALVLPEGDVLPVRTIYSGFTQNVGNNYLTSEKPIWVAGPDVINSMIQAGKPPRILRAIRLVPRGMQSGLQAVRLRGTVDIDPCRDDLFCKIVEERMANQSDKDLYHWLKTFANSIYGCFVEINPETLSQRKAVRVHVYSGEESFIPRKHYRIVERHGPWYAPYLGSLITSGGRLLLGMLQRCVEEKHGTYAWADTDSLAVVSTLEGGTLNDVPGCEDKRILPRAEVQEIVDRFATLNPYRFPGSILRYTKHNFVDSDTGKGFRQLLGFCISAKRYCVYERDGENITVIDPKGHGLGYLYPPADSPPGWDDEHDLPNWIYKAWEFLLRLALHLDRNDPAWLRRPQMMRMAMTTQSLLKRVHGWKRFRPYNAFFVPVLAQGGYPANVDPARFTLATQVEEDQSKWVDSVCVNLDDTKDKKRYRLTTDFESADFGERAVADTYQAKLCRYLCHPESKSLGPDGKRCELLTWGLLQREHIIAATHRRFGKEVDRRWEEGDDLEAARQRPIAYERTPARAGEPTVRSGLHFSQLVRKIGIRKLMRQGFGRRILQKISRREPVRASTLRDYEREIEQYIRTTRRIKDVRSR